MLNQNFYFENQEEPINIEALKDPHYEVERKNVTVLTQYSKLSHGNVSDSDNLGNNNLSLFYL